MRKLLLSFFVIFVSIAVNAQETGDSVLRSKKGIPILPQKGDWAIGADAGPYLSYLGNIFNNTTNNSLYFDDYTLYGRYYLSDNTALRFRFSAYNYNNITKHNIQDDAASVLDPLAETEDSYKNTYSSNSLSIAYLKFRGYGRLRGFYGVEAGMGWYRERHFYSYGNPMTVANTNPHMYWDSNNDNQRTLEIDEGVNKHINLGLVAGVEYYFAPKICIGSEISLTGRYNWKSQGNTIIERFNGSEIIEEDKADSPKGRTSTSLYSNYGSNFGGSLYLMFHF